MAQAKKAFSDAERKAMQDRVRELELEAESGQLKGRAKLEKQLLDTIAAMPEADRVLAETIHALVGELAPTLRPKTMYGMPAWANEEGKTVLMFQAASKWDSRYATLAFEDRAQLDDGNMWPTAYAITELTEANRKKIAELISRAVRQN